MADRTVRVRLSAEVSDYIAKLVQAGAATRKLAEDTVKTAKTNKQEWSQASTGLMAFGAAAVAGVGMAVKTYADFDAQMSAVKSTGSDAAQNIDKLRAAAMEAGAAFGQFSGADAAKGIEELAKAGLSAQQILSGGLNGALSLAAAGQIEVGEAAEVTAKTLSQFSLDGAQASHVADLLAAGAGKAVGDVHDMGEALKMTGTVAAQYGVSVEETTGTLALFAQNAMLGSDAGTSMKQMLLQLASPTKQAQKMLDAYNISAYDAQGNFVGMASLAEQLKSRLGDLSTEQQNAALKTIFGADAIRGANILMKEGAAGVQEWTKAVDDQGYASEVAGTKMDNLQGDLRALGGSWENLQIQMGEGANGGLRDATQQLTALLDAAGRHPQAVQTVALIAGGLGALALTAGGVMKAVTAVSEFRGALATLKGADGLTGALAGNLGKMGAAAGIAGAALVAFGAASAAVQSHLEKQLQTTEQVDRAMRALASGNGKAMAGFNADIDKMVLGSNDLAGAIKHLDAGGLEGGVRKFFGAWNNFPGVTTTAENFRNELDKIDQSLTSMKPADAAAAFNTLSREMQAQGVGAEQLVGHFDAYKARLEQQANALADQVPAFDAAKLSAEDYARWMGGEVPGSVKIAIDAARSMGGEQAKLAASIDASTTSAEDNAEAIAKMAEAQLAASGSMIGLEAAIDAASESVENNGRTLDLNTEKGRANQSALDGIAASGLKVVDSLEQAGASTAEIAGAQERAAGSFITAAKAAGMTRDKAVELAQKYGLIPKDVSTEIKSLWERGQYDLAMKKMAEADGKKSTTTIETRHVDIYTQINRVVREQTSTGLGGSQYATAARADGGIIYGPGGPTDDAILARLSNGEYVVKAASVAKLGLARLDYLNRHGELPAFASGGLAGGMQQATGQMRAPSMPAYMGAASAQASGQAMARGGGMPPIQITANGPDAREVVDHAVARMTHLQRLQAVQMPGG